MPHAAALLYVFWSAFRGAKLDLNLGDANAFINSLSELPAPPEELRTFLKVFNSTTTELRELVSEKLRSMHEGEMEAFKLFRRVTPLALTAYRGTFKHVHVQIRPNTPLQLGEFVDTAAILGEAEVAREELMKLLRPSGGTQYAAALQENAVNSLSDLALLSTEDLKEIGVGPLMHRKRLVALAAGQPLPLPPAESEEHVRKRLGELLTPLSLEGLVGLFFEHGFAILEDLATLTDADLKELGVTALVHRKKLLSLFATASPSSSTTLIAAPGSATPTSPPEKIPGYTLGTVLGTGAFGQVFRAVDVTLDRQVAIKVLHASHAQRPESRARFVAEARAVAKLNHKNIITIYSVVEAPELAIVMELIEGTTLEGIIQERGHLDAACAKQTIIQCLQGLAHAHHERG